MSEPSSTNESGETPPTLSLFHSTLRQDPVTEPNTKSIFETPKGGNPIPEYVFGTRKDNVSIPKKDPEPSDWEYDSHDSFTSEPGRYPSDDLSETPAIENRTIDNPVDMGEAIEFSFPHNPEYDLDGEDMFDDGIDDEESECSDASTNYEELPEPDAHLAIIMAPRILEVPSAETGDEMEEDMALEGVSDEDASDESYEPSSDEEDLNQPNAGKTSNAVSNFMLGPFKLVQLPSSPGTLQATPQVPLTATNSDVPTSSSTKLSQVLTTDLELKQQEKVRDASQWKLLELQEALRNMELHIIDAKAAFKEAEAAVISHNTSKLMKIVGSGLSVELFEAYQDFCESLQPEFGMRDGFSITCYHAHKGSYLDYDPEFDIFKGSVEMEYNTCNFRCEAGKEPISQYRPKELVDVVHFWPLRCPEPRTGLETTWGEQFPKLYGLAIEAAKQGSEAAMEMLMKLPLPDGALSGWMFEYQFEKLLEREPVVSRRWVFKQAQNIDEPMTQEEKKLWLQRQVAA